MGTGINWFFKPDSRFFFLLFFFAGARTFPWVSGTVISAGPFSWTRGWTVLLVSIKPSQINYLSVFQDLGIQKWIRHGAFFQGTDISRTQGWYERVRCRLMSREAVQSCTQSIPVALKDQDRLRLLEASACILSFKRRCDLARKQQQQQKSGRKMAKTKGRYFTST